jgi:hypothetical protein
MTCLACQRALGRTGSIPGRSRAWLVRAGREAPMVLAYSAGSGLAVHRTAWRAALSTTRAAHEQIILDEASH